MAWVAVGVGGLSLGSSAFKYFKGKSQQKRANELRENAQDPGFQVNQALIDNANFLRDRYSNYVMPGYQQALNNINQAGATSFDRGVQGASSSGDVLSLASQIAYGQGQAQNQLALQNTQSKEGALGQYLNANAAAGQQYQDQNAYDRQRYQEQLGEAAGLYNAGATNEGNAVNEFGSTLGQFIGSGVLGSSGGKSSSAITGRAGSVGVQANNTLPQYDLNGNPIITPINYNIFNRPQ